MIEEAMKANAIEALEKATSAPAPDVQKFLPSELASARDALQKLMDDKKKKDEVEKVLDEALAADTTEALKAAVEKAEAIASLVDAKKLADAKEALAKNERIDAAFAALQAAID